MGLDERRGRGRQRILGGIAPGRPVGGLGVLLALTLAAGTAQANGRFPTSNELVFEPGNPNVAALRATFGVLRSTDAGKTWFWICEDAIGYGMITVDPALGFTAGGALLAATPVGLAVSPDTGCTWRVPNGVLAGPVVDVAVRPLAPHQALAIASSPDGTTSACVPLFTTGIYASNDDGATWSPYGTTFDPTVQPTTVEVAANDPHRVYVTGLRTSQATASLFVSTDDAQTWTEHPIPLDASTESAAFVAAVDPTNDARVYLRTGPVKSRLLVTDDAGMTLRSVFTGQGPMMGFALSSDGATVYVGGPADGVQVASTSAFSFKQVSTTPINCLALQGPTLYACFYESSILLASSTTGGQTFSPVLHLKDLEGPLTCPSGTETAACAQEWPPLAAMYMIGDAAALPAAGLDATTTPPPTPSPASPPARGGCGCRASSTNGVGLGLLASLGLVAVRVVRRRPQQQR